VIQIEIAETGPGTAAALSGEQGALLARSQVVNAVPSPFRPGWWQVSAAGKVGAARIGDIALFIRPKVPIARLLFLAGYATAGPSWQPQLIEAGQADDLVPVVADALWRQVSFAVHQGLLPGYLVVEESSPVLRGRLRESEQLRRHHGLPLPLEISHDEFTVDIAENQILRTACERMLMVPGVSAESALRVRRLLREFADVTPLDRRDPVPAWQPTRLNGRYHGALRLGELVLRATSFEHTPGDIAVHGFLLDMPVLFEDFVTEALGEALAGRYGGRVCPQDWNPFDEAGRVRLRPDLVWKVGGVPVAVVDAKYKAESPSGYPNADLYQLLAYCTVLGLRHGHLVYTKGDAETAHHLVRRADIEIHCHALELAAEPPTLLAHVSELADSVAQYSTVVSNDRH
jgi:5-methylcytosine-specific restriction enzyme subunit McrC